MEASALQEGNTLIFDLLLLFAAFMYVKLLFYYLLEHVCSVEPRKVAFHACLHRCNVS